MNYDYLSEIAQIIYLLERDGRHDCANKIRDARDIASTSSELLMAVRHQLKACLDSELLDPTRKKLQLLEKQIGNLLT